MSLSLAIKNTLKKIVIIYQIIIENGTDLIFIDENGTLIKSSSIYAFFRTCKVAFFLHFHIIKKYLILIKGIHFYLMNMEALSFCIHIHWKIYVDHFLSSSEPLGTVCLNTLAIYDKHSIIHTLVPYIVVYMRGNIYTIYRGRKTSLTG